mmetsp:Transcript_16588/g.23447  ORF Transcript_16588/g.23447 Transcript_16588/m.23447 type:complete len:302 (-) Transcript_16588:469-1374(-)
MFNEKVSFIFHISHLLFHEMCPSSSAFWTFVALREKFPFPSFGHKQSVATLFTFVSHVVFVGAFVFLNFLLRIFFQKCLSLPFALLLFFHRLQILNGRLFHLSQNFLAPFLAHSKQFVPFRQLIPIACALSDRLFSHRSLSSSHNLLAAASIGQSEQIPQLFKALLAALRRIRRQLLSIEQKFASYPRQPPRHVFTGIGQDFGCFRIAEPKLFLHQFHGFHRLARNGLLLRQLRHERREHFRPKLSRSQTSLVLLCTRRHRLLTVVEFDHILTEGFDQALLPCVISFPCEIHASDYNADHR